MVYKKHIKDFELTDILDCGQCFRWNKQMDVSYIGVFGNNVVKLSKNKNEIVFEGNFIDEKSIIDYFDLNRDYGELKKRISSTDSYLEKAVEYGSGIRLLNQDLWETIISFIISANNNIPRIKGIIERLSKKYGKRIEWDGEDYYTFPTPNELAKACQKDLRELGLGFRDKYVYETTKRVIEGKFDLNKLEKMSTENARRELISLPGVGPKVADCILLFSTLKRLDVFPIDVWVRRVMNELYIHNPVEKNVRKSDILKLAKDKFGDLQGLAQQYLFYWIRENS